MCKVGDIILVYNAKNKDGYVGPHQFVIMDNEAGQIKGLDYDIISAIMSSMDTDKKLEKYHKYPGNFSIMPEDRQVDNDNRKPAFVKVDQLYYFDLDAIDYKKIGQINTDIMELLYEHLDEINNEGVLIERYADNLKGR